MPSSSWDRFPPPAKPLPVEDGIKARSRRGAMVQTWWSQRFLDVLESFGMGPRLQRGRHYARRGQVISMDVARGQVTAEVQGSRARPYRVTVGVAELSDADWEHATDELAARAIFLAKLLAGEMPAEVEEAFAACDLTLFPSTLDDLATACSCPDWANPCKHIAAVYYLLADAFDDDPFLIFAWRGRDRETLLAHLRARRGGSAAPAEERDPEEAWPTIELPRLADCIDEYWLPAAPLPAEHAAPRAAAVPDALLRQLAPAEITVRGRPLEQALAPAYAALTEGAARLAR